MRAKGKTAHIEESHGFLRVLHREFHLAWTLAAIIWIAEPSPVSAAEPSGEVLYNGIVLPAVWPPADRDPASRQPMPVPYLTARPAVVPIDVGRQLFIDDFLIENTTLWRTFHQPQKFEGNPILVPETAHELHRGHRPAAAPHSGGAWFDHRDGLFKMWYMTGWYGGAALAYSKDGLRWTRPDLGILPGTNHIPDPSPELKWGWVGADDLDLPDPAVGDPPQIYDLEVTPYESLLVGLFQVHRGPANNIAQKNRVPKMTELAIGYTRDGFHWHRPVRTPFIPATRQPGNWERAYVHSVGGGMLIVGDRLFIYYSGLSGEAPNGPDMYAGGPGYRGPVDSPTGF